MTSPQQGVPDEEHLPSVLQAPTDCPVTGLLEVEAGSEEDVVGVYAAAGADVDDGVGVVVGVVGATYAAGVVVGVVGATYAAGVVELVVKVEDVIGVLVELALKVEDVVGVFEVDTEVDVVETAAASTLLVASAPT